MESSPSPFEPVSQPIAVPKDETKPTAEENGLLPNPATSPIPDIISSLAQTRLNTPSSQSTRDSPASHSPKDEFFFRKPVNGGAMSSSDIVSPVALSPPKIKKVLNGEPKSKLNIKPISRSVSPAPLPGIVPSRRNSNGNVNTVNGRKPPPVTAPPSDFTFEPRKRHLSIVAGHSNLHRRLTHDKNIFSEAAWSVEAQHGGNGGLRNAINRAEIEHKFSKKLLVGTLGMNTDALDHNRKFEIATHLKREYECEVVYVKDSTFEGHYTHYCKQILWPTLHYQVPDDFKSKAYEDHSWDHYKKLNEAFAEKIVQVYTPGDIIWINDYHLLLVSELVRKKLPNAKIGLFIHVSFPSSEVFRCLASRKQILEGMLGANCIGFQIADYSRHFLQTCNRILAVDTTPFGIRAEGKFVSVSNCPIGIDPVSLKGQLNQEGVRKWRQMIRERWKNKKLIVSRDKYDHIRGIKQKLLAYEEFLNNYPEWIEQAILIQVCLPSVGETELENEISVIVDRINSFAVDLSTQPLLFLQQDLEFIQYLALIVEADVFVTTALREGMNLTCHEFIYCNDQAIRGPLILSEFTGAASVLGNKSILVNPWDKRQMAQAYYAALTMSDKEKYDRWQELHDYVSEHTCSEWVEDFIKFVQESWEEEQQKKLNSLHRLDWKKLQLQYRQVPNQSKRIFFVNFDGLNDGSGTSNPPTSTMPSAMPSAAPSRTSSTTSLHHHMESNGYNTNPLNRLSMLRQSSSTRINTYISPQRKISVLSQLVSDARNIVYVLSNDSRATLERMFKRVSNIGLISENGAFLRPFGNVDQWKVFVDSVETQKWKAMVKPVLESLVERFSGSWIQMNESSIFFHVNSILNEEDPERAHSIIGECINHINDAFGNENIRARLIEGGKVVISSEQVSKLKAVQYAFDLQLNVEYLFVAGESGESTSLPDDDELFAWANSKTFEIFEVCTVAIGTNGTNAKWALEGVNGLLNVLMNATE